MWGLKIKREEIEKPVAEENRTSTELEVELCSNHGHQEKLREQLQGLEKRLRVVQATISREEIMQDKADKVGHGVLVGN